MGRSDLKWGQGGRRGSVPASGLQGNEPGPRWDRDTQESIPPKMLLRRDTPAIGKRGTGEVGDSRC